MKAKEIQELIDFISHSGLAEVKIETDEFKLSIKKSADAPAAVRMVETPAQMVTSHNSAPSPQNTPSPSSTSADEVNIRHKEIKSPMIGTFYRSSNPETGPFVSVGDTIQAGQTVGIIEAMKLFNEIDAEISGKIVKVLVENSSPVEFDQPLFLIEVAE
ncbi:acetyl-CoA carboxylase biotin carboxyl carrier protein [Lunatibacter salilacus]|uniref:acetyl-CoA carboxylase biotin carboxyl carrier protein n=1 Tax=Lunatibacter salilacus TaxID=2483804 RepID=UPI00131E6D1C|nr:acetyl-CoA carboxylase biotin carboxyl carrier protein [Lunatibacter salilacus]